ncbi:unnamed protein product [Miscanthus lutarioriparius]|uniref:Uncharacterized protein n=1 Tax=Miscanthus lutarioriparius TaxID=422564 RepID=A0A811QNB5_9POAL|nr:unnamed protein product [Miscanthus lutarioriparius]
MEPFPDSPTMMGGRRWPRTPIPDSEVVELELLRPSHGSSTDDEGHNTQPPSADVSLLTQLEARVCIPLETPLISKPRPRRSRTPSTMLSVRRSGRLAAKVQAQNVLKQKLGIADMKQGLEPAALDSIKALFAEPLSPSK